MKFKDQKLKLSRIGTGRSISWLDRVPVSILKVPFTNLDSEDKVSVNFRSPKPWGMSVEQ